MRRGLGGADDLRDVVQHGDLAVALLAAEPERRDGDAAEVLHGHVAHEHPRAPLEEDLRLSWLRRRMKNELNSPPNFERLVLGCIDADFCK